MARACMGMRGVRRSYTSIKMDDLLSSGEAPGLLLSVVANQTDVAACIPAAQLLVLD